MPTTVELQEALESSPLLLIISIVVLLAFAAVAFWILWRMKHPKPIKIKTIPAPQLSQIKSEYISKIDVLSNAYIKNEIREREAFVELSFLIRSFVKDATGIKVTHYTLSDIKKLGKQELTTLIETCYPPEFGPDNHDDLPTVAQRSKQVISIWN